MAYQVSLIYIILYFLAKVQGRCHECQSNFAICHDEKRFSMCADGISVSKMQTCPNDYVCTDQTEICVKSSTINSVQPTCDAGCGVCDSPDKLFACVNEKTYAYCFGAESYDNGAMGQCPDEYVCNLGSRQICTPASEVYPSCFDGSSIVATTVSPTESPTVSPTVSPTESPSVSPTVSPTESPSVSPTKSPSVSPTLSPTESPTVSPTVTPTESPSVSPTESPSVSPIDSPTVSPTAPPTSATTPTTSTQHPRDVSKFCEQKQIGGFYKSENDPTCHEYIMCWILSGQYLGIRYTCPGDYYFNENKNECQAAKPANC